MDITWYDPPNGYVRCTPCKGSVQKTTAGTTYTAVKCDFLLQHPEWALQYDVPLPGWNLLRAEGAQDVAMLEALAEARYALA